jgi:diguanylate cyclase (GGDEF)-like protein
MGVARVIDSGTVSQSAAKLHEPAPPLRPTTPRVRLERLLCWLLLLVLLATTAWVVLLSHLNVEQRRAGVFAAETAVVSLRLEERLAPYRNLSRNLIGFFLANERIEQREWSIYLLALQLDRQLVHLQHVWFAFEMNGEAAPHYLRQRSNPAQQRDLAWPRPLPASGGIDDIPPVRTLPLLYVHPMSVELEGHDIYRHNQPEIELAYDRRETTLATSMSLSATEPTGLAFISPLFRQSELAGSVRPSLEGVLGVSLATESLFGGLLVDAPARLALSVYRGSDITPEALLFESGSSHAAHSQAAHFNRVEQVEFDGQSLALHFSVPADWDVAGVDRRMPWFTAFAGLVISLLGFAIARSLESTRERAMAIAERMTIELRLANRALEEMATTDSLTGLLNRRAFFDRLRSELQRVQRYQEHCTVLLLDIDHFKSVNDTYGHPAGDAVLAQLGAMLRQASRAADVAARVGGEEFAVLLPHTDVQQGYQAAEQMRARLQAHTFNEGNARFHCTASFGVAGTSDSVADTAESLLKQADRALYRAKETGRNRVVLAADAMELPAA